MSNYIKIKLRDVPWFVDDAVDFIEKEIDEGNIKSVLEFGSGASTIWFADRVDIIVSVEHSRQWYDSISEILKRKTNLDYRLRGDNYQSVCKEELPVKLFDMVVVDGRDRVACSIEGGKLLKSGGLLVLDNSEREEFQEIHEYYKEWESFSWTQQGPDKEGFDWDGQWDTTIFIKK